MSVSVKKKQKNSAIDRDGKDTVAVKVDLGGQGTGVD